MSRRARAVDIHNVVAPSFLIGALAICHRHVEPLLPVPVILSLVLVMSAVWASAAVRAARVHRISLTVIACMSGAAAASALLLLSYAFAVDTGHPSPAWGQVLAGIFLFLLSIHFMNVAMEPS